MAQASYRQQLTSGNHALAPQRKYSKPKKLPQRQPSPQKRRPQQAQSKRKPPKQHQRNAVAHTGRPLSALQLIRWTVLCGFVICVLALLVSRSVKINAINRANNSMKANMAQNELIVQEANTTIAALQTGAAISGASQFMEPVQHSQMRAFQPLPAQPGKPQDGHNANLLPLWLQRIFG